MTRILVPPPSCLDGMSAAALAKEEATEGSRITPSKTLFQTPTRRWDKVGGTSGACPERSRRFYLEPVEGADAPQSDFLSVKLDVCIVTHNPRRPVFALVLQSIARQSLVRDAFHLWIIDNASTPPLTEADLVPLRQGGIPHTLVLETRLGNAYGRAKAIEVTSSEWIVFVDDDNELTENYLETVLEIVRQKPHLGCFGGKLLLPPTYQVEPWIHPLLPYLAIKDCGDEAISNCVKHWGIWEPPTAGAAVRRPVLQLFSERMRLIGDAGRLGRRGRSGLMSCEDGVMMRGACSLGLHCSYEPRLKLFHHIAPARLKFKYLLRLCYYYGRSTVLMERILGHEVAAQTAKDAWKLVTTVPRGRKKACNLAWYWGRFAESRNKSDMAVVATRLATATVPLVSPSPASSPAAPAEICTVLNPHPGGLS